LTVRVVQASGGEVAPVSRFRHGLVGSSGSILAYSNNVALTGTSLSALLTSEGSTFTPTTAPPFTLETLMQNDSVWLAGTSGSGAANAQVLISYVHAGGNVLV